LVYIRCHTETPLALIKVGEDKVVSSWKDSLASGRFTNISEYLKIQKKRLFIDRRKKEIINRIYD
jgi:hypothetical protein